MFRVQVLSQILGPRSIVSGVCTSVLRANDVYWKVFCASSKENENICKTVNLDKVVLYIHIYIYFTNSLFVEFEMRFTCHSQNRDSKYSVSRWWTPIMLKKLIICLFFRHIGGVGTRPCLNATRNHLVSAFNIEI